MISHRAALLTAALLASAVLATSPAEARRIVIDEGEFITPPTLGAGCTIGVAGCAATILPFSFDFGTGLTNQAFIYNSGIVSFGAEIPTGVDPLGSFLDFGVPVIAPLYDPTASGVAGPYQTGSRIFGVDEFVETQPNFGTDMFLISWLDPATVVEEDLLAGYVHLILDASPTELRFEFIHGQSNNVEGQIVITLPNVVGTNLGYSVLGETLFDDTPDISPEAVHAYSVGTPAAIPEPATWMMLLLGFGAVGYVLRWCRKAQATLRSA
jgi:PEP-CTERM motif-containing protein